MRARRVATAAVFATMWAAPYALPFQALGVSRVGRLGGASWAAPDALPFREGPHAADLGWYLTLVLGVAWPLLATWSTVEELPAFASRRPARAEAAWIAGLLAGLAIAGASWVIWPSLCFWCSRWETPSSVVKVHHIALVEGGIAVAMPSLVVLVARSLRRPLDVARVPVHRWVAAVALFLFATPPYLLLAKSSELILFALASWTMWVRELPPLEARFGRARVRLAIVALAGVPLLVALAIGARFRPAPRFALLPALHLGIAALVAAAGLLFVVLCMTAADGLAGSLRRAQSVRARMLSLGLVCALLAFVLSGVYVPVDVVGEGETSPSLVLTLVGKMVCVGIMVAVLSATLSRGLSRSLERSVEAIGEIRQGNLDVALDDSGRDEVAAVARSFNALVARLREAEFLERINADLRARSAQLGETLDALRAAQADLVRSERMASVAALVKGIAHELNNPVNYIAGNIAPLRRYCEFLSGVATALADGRVRSEDELAALTRLTERKDLAFVSDDLAKLTADIGEGARRAQLIISDLQSLTSAAQRGVEQVDLHRVVRQTISLLGAGVPPGVKLETDLAPVPPLPALAGQLEQALVNLTDNALRAVGQRGTVRISVRGSEGQALVSVKDDGPGMSDEVQRKAFEPFFTTRPAGEGSGLGLAIVASIVRAHRGTVVLTSELGKGTDVELRLPLDAGRALSA